MTTIRITKKGHDNPIVLANGDAYDGLLEVLNDKGKIQATFHTNTDPTNTYNGGEIAAGEYIYKKHVRTDGRIVYNLYTKDGSNILPSVKPNKNHKGKKIIQAVQIHCGGRMWDGSHGCITIPPTEWWAFRQSIEDEGVVIVIEKKQHGKEDENG